MFHGMAQTFRAQFVARKLLGLHRRQPIGGGTGVADD